MKKTSLLLLAVFTAMFLISSCGEQKKIVEINELDVYSDPATGFSIKYPKSWKSHNNLGERFLSYTTKDVLGRFKTYATEGVAGAKIDYQVVRLKDGETIDTVMSKKLFQSNVYSAPEKVTIDGVDGYKQTYKFPLSDGQFEGEIYYAQKDSNLVAIINFEAFGDLFDHYRPKFKEILGSIVLPKIKEAKSDTIKQVLEADPPSQNLVVYNGNGFSIKVPDNFDVKKPKANSYKFDGERRGDCYILIDITDASKQSNLDKIVKDNKAKFGGKDPKATSLGGQKAYVFQYSPGGKINRKAYFAVKDKKLYRIIVDWNRVEDKDLFYPIFMKSVASFKFK
jgi:hypothetical protein